MPERPTMEVLGNAWLQTDRNASLQLNVLRPLVERGEWSELRRDLGDLFGGDALIIYDETHVRWGHRAAWLFIPGSPHPWYCGQFELGAVPDA